MNTVIDLSDPRTRRAIVLAADAGQWARCTDRYGRHFFAIPSSKADVRYFTTADSCSCPDQTFKPHLECKHRAAVRIFEALAS